MKTWKVEIREGVNVGGRRNILGFDFSGLPSLPIHPSTMNKGWLLMSITEMVRVFSYDLSSKFISSLACFLQRLAVFEQADILTLTRCALVCKEWSREALKIVWGKGPVWDHELSESSCVHFIMRSLSYLDCVISPPPCMLLFHLTFFFY